MSLTTSLPGLLSASFVVSISGGFKACLAYLMLDAEPNIFLCGSFSLVVYSIYTLDRAFGPEEDKVNRDGENRENVRIALIAASLSLAVAVVILLTEGASPVVAFFPLLMGYLYGKGVEVGGKVRRLKGSYGVKNLVVALSWAISLGMLISPSIESFSSLVLISTFFFFKSFINTVVYDCGDVKGDSRVGLKTIPAYLGMARTRILLQVLNSSFHVATISLVLAGLAEISLIVLLYSWIVGLVYISVYAKCEEISFRDVTIDGEWIHMLIFRCLAVQFL